MTEMTTDGRLPFAEKLRRLMRDRDISGRELVQRSGVKTHSTLNRWLKGDGEPTVTDLQRLADALAVPAAYLVCEGGEKVAPAPPGVEPSDLMRRYLEAGRAVGLDDATFILDFVKRIGKEEASRRLWGSGVQDRGGRGEIEPVGP